MGWKVYALAMLLFNFGGPPARLPPPARAGRPPAEPAGLRRGVARLLVQHRGELRHQHQLAGIRRRVDDELPHPDARAHRPELRVRRRRHGRPGRAHPRIRAALGRRPSATSGSISRGRRSTSCCPCPSSGAWPWSPRAWSRPSAAYPKVTVVQPTQLRRARDRQGRQAGPRRQGSAQDQEVDADRAGHRGGPGRIADRHQAARNQRRRLLQRQLRASLRERDAAVELPRGPRDPDDPRRALLHVRGHGRRHPPGLDGPGRDDRDLRRPPGRVRTSPSSTARCSPSRASTTRRARSSRAATWKGKEVRFGIANSALWATATTAASNGSVNSMHDSFTPIGGLVPMWLDPARRGGLRRRRLGPLRHADVRHRRGLRRRASWSGARPNTSARRSRRTR